MKYTFFKLLINASSELDVDLWFKVDFNFLLKQCLIKQIFMTLLLAILIQFFSLEHFKEQRLRQKLTSLKAFFFNKY